jgi:hypothetical protein
MNVKRKELKIKDRYKIYYYLLIQLMFEDTSNINSFVSSLFKKSIIIMLLYLENEYVQFQVELI